MSCTCSAGGTSGRVRIPHHHPTDLFLAAVPALPHIPGPGSGSSTEDSGLASQCPPSLIPSGTSLRVLQNTPQGRLHPRPVGLQNPPSLCSTLPEISLRALRGAQGKSHPLLQAVLHSLDELFFQQAPRPCLTKPLHPGLKICLSPGLFSWCGILVG